MTTRLHSSQDTSRQASSTAARINRRAAQRHPAEFWRHQSMAGHLFGSHFTQVHQLPSGGFQESADLSGFDRQFDLSAGLSTAGGRSPSALTRGPPRRHNQVPNSGKNWFRLSRYRHSLRALHILPWRSEQSGNWYSPVPPILRILVSRFGRWLLLRWLGNQHPASRFPVRNSAPIF